MVRFAADEAQDSDGEESSLSLSDLPTMTPPALQSAGRRSPPPPDFFEFFPSFPSADMCAADDVILRGKLLPFRAPPALPSKKTQTHFPDSLPFDHHRRSNSLDDRRLWGGKLTAEYRKLKRVSESDPKVHPDPPRPRPRWFVLAFGSVRVPAAMEMKEIRIRQRRRSAPPIGVRTAAEESGERVPWRILRSLSCKGVETAVVV